MIGAVLSHADFTERVVGGGVGGAGVDDGEQVLNGVGLLVDGLGGGFAVEFGDALLDLEELAELEGAGLVAGIAGGVVGLDEGFPGEAGLGEGFVLGVFEQRHGASMSLINTLTHRR